jgi:hypothetical protein
MGAAGSCISAWQSYIMVFKLIPSSLLPSLIPATGKSVEECICNLNMYRLTPGAACMP